jgi:hypothetical protein
MRDDLPQRKFRKVLCVPYSEKNMARQAGAKWSALDRRWFIDDPLLVKKVKRWLPREKPAGKQEGMAGKHGRAAGR